MPLVYSPRCCVTPKHDINCFFEDICEHHTRIARRHKRSLTKRKRLHLLARPKYITPKFQQPCICNSLRKTEIIREMPCCTRTEQLSYPWARKLYVNHKEYARVLGPERLSVLNRTIRKSVLSLYSRLASFNPPKRKKCVPRWNKKQWASHSRYCAKLARPKKIFKPPKQDHVWKELSAMKRFKKLAKPKKRQEIPPTKWELTDALKNYRATKRILDLCRPKERDENIHFQPLPIQVTPEAMAYKASARIKELATPPEVRLGESDLKENPFGISPNALKAKASARVLELATPKEFEDTHTRANPFMISPAALKAKATPRLLELAKPKGS